MHKRFSLVILLVLMALTLTSPAHSFAYDMGKDYTLPYPPQMPGNFQYKIRILQEKIDQLWSFGSFAQFQYDLKTSDKYLVQAKTLLEYDQYLLAADALNKSTVYFAKLDGLVQQAKTEGKDVSEEVKTQRRAAKKHIDVLTYLKGEAPSTVVWRPEKAQATDLSFTKLLDEAIAVRQKSL